MFVYVSLFPLVQTCVNQLGVPVAHYKKDIESHFKSIKSLQARLGIGQQGLTVELQQWLVMGRTSCEDMVRVLQSGIVLWRLDPVTYWHGDIVSCCRLDGVTSQLTAEALSFNPSLTHGLSPVVRTSQLMNEPN